MSAAKDKAPKEGKPGFKLPKLALPKISFKPPKLKPPDLSKLAAKIPAERLARLKPNGMDASFLLAMLLVGGISAGSAAIAMRFAMPQQIVVRTPAAGETSYGTTLNPEGFPDITTGPNVPSDFSLSMERPAIAETSYVHPQASVVGYAEIGEHVYVGPQVSVRADEGKIIRVGNECNLQDGAILHALPTEEKGVKKLENTVVVDGNEYALHLGDRVTVCPQAQVFGPAAVGDDTWLGMQTLVFRARIGPGCVLEPRSAAIGVSIPEGRYVPAGMVVTQQDQADKLPRVEPGYAYQHANELAVRVHTQLAEGYRALKAGGSEHSRQADVSKWTGEAARSPGEAPAAAPHGEAPHGEAPHGEPGAAAQPGETVLTPAESPPAHH